MTKINATISIERIAANQAEIMLENMVDGQRKLREIFISQLAEEMRMGRFRLSSDAVLLIKGKLANGQHRLAAIVQSGLSQLFIIMRTQDERLFEVLDCGRPRTIADVLFRDGFDHARDQASIAKLVVLYDKGLLTRFGFRRGKHKGTWTRGEIIEYAREHNDSLSEIAKFVSPLYKRHKILARSLAGALIEITDRKYPGRGKEFIEKVYVGGINNDAAFDIRERLIQLSIMRTKSLHELRREYVFGLLIKSFMLYIAKKRTGVLKIVDGEEYPKIS